MCVCVDDEASSSLDTIKKQGSVGGLGSYVDRIASLDIFLNIFIPH